MRKRRRVQTKKKKKYNLREGKIIVIKRINVNRIKEIREKNNAENIERIQKMKCKKRKSVAVRGIKERFRKREKSKEGEDKI